LPNFMEWTCTIVATVSWRCWDLNSAKSLLGKHPTAWATPRSERVSFYNGKQKIKNKVTNKRNVLLFLNAKGIFFVSFLTVLGFELMRQALYHLSQASSPCFVLVFETGSYYAAHAASNSRSSCWD
jgi:hypothetical protein